MDLEEEKRSERFVSESPSAGDRGGDVDDDYNNFGDLMDQLHPLRGAELADIFPLFKRF